MTVPRNRFSTLGMAAACFLPSARAAVSWSIRCEETEAKIRVLTDADTATRIITAARTLSDLRYAVEVLSRGDDVTELIAYLDDRKGTAS